METLSESLFGREAAVEDVEFFECSGAQLDYMIGILKRVSDEVFRNRYVTSSDGFPECRALVRITELKICIEVLARCPPNQYEHFGTYNILSHKDFEKVLEKYSKTRPKSNEVMSRSRNWDVAINMFMKVEFFDPNQKVNPKQVTLKRESQIYNVIWRNYVAENGELDEMTGIPMVFDYRCLLNKHNVFKPSTAHKEIDLFGCIVPMEFDHEQQCSNLRYLTVEKLGPNLAYLIEVYKRGSVKLPILSFATAFKMFDQLICRLLQLHRLGVIHNNIQPNNIYFGRMVCFDVVYLNSFKAATVMETNFAKHKRYCSFFGNPRYAAIDVMKGLPRHPAHDIESAFYTLLAVLTPQLPWDEGSKQVNGQNWNNEEQEFSLQRIDDEDTQSEAWEHKKRVVKMKEDMWANEDLLHKILASMHQFHQFIDEDNSDNRQNYVALILKSVYRVVRNMIVDRKRGSVPEVTPKSLRVVSSDECQLYFELRRNVLALFNVHSPAHFLDHQTYKTKVASCEPGTLFPWDLSSWCFSHMSLKE